MLTKPNSVGSSEKRSCNLETVKLIIYFIKDPFMKGRSNSTMQENPRKDPHSN